MCITDEYLFYQEKYSKKYGVKTIILMQVGSFFEMYCTEDRGYDLTEVSNLLNIVKTRKDKSKDEITLSNPYMVGFPLAAIHKFTKIFIDNDFTVVKIEHVTAPPDPKREVTGIYSPGTYISDSNTQDSNNLLCLYIEDEIQPNNTILMCIGMSVIDLSTAKNCVYECYGVDGDDKVSLDEASRFIHSYSPKEILIFRKNTNNANINIMKKEKLLLYLEIENKNYHYYDVINKNFFKLSYQTEFLEKVFKDHGMTQVIEYLALEKLSYATLSYICLLDYAYQQNEKIINNIDKPSVFLNNKHLILGNNAIFQLNVFENENLKGFNKKFKCLFDVINNTSTAPGRRYLKNTLIAPLTSVDELNSRYNNTEEALTNNFYIKLEDYLKKIMDIERLQRKISLKIAHPWELYTLLLSYENVKKLITLVKKTKCIKNIIVKDKYVKSLDEFIDKLNKTFIIDELKKYNLNDITDSFFNVGVDKDIDEIQKKINNNMTFMDDICNVLSGLINNNNKSKNNKFKKKSITNNKKDKEEEEQEQEASKIKISKNDRDGYYLLITATRYEILINSLKGLTNIKLNNEYTLKVKDLEFKPVSSSKKSNYKIILKDLSEISDKTVVLREKLTNLIKTKYTNLLETYYNDYSTLFNNLTEFIASVDFIKSSAKTAHLYNYCKPTIVNNKDKSFIKCKQLRHPIIERISTDVEYVPHDIILGCNTNTNSNSKKDQKKDQEKDQEEDIDGMLIYGINSAGKSSLMKAIGLSVILAQCGMYVPAIKYEFAPYDTLFARITSTDNIFKGLSSFVLEMVELNCILKRATSKTLVIGDEVCKGTESISGNSIVAAAIIKLSQSKSSFIFATHLHAIINIERIKNLKNVKSFHLTVEYDEKNDCLIFDRLLKPGSGDSVYGITVAKYIIHDAAFMRLAQDIKNELLETPNVLLKDKKSKYNSDVYIDSCSVCQKRKTISGYYETHHINYQKDCENKFVKSKPHIKMNDKSNLAPLCEKCHLDVHNNKLKITGYIMTSNGVKLNYS